MRAIIQSNLTNVAFIKWSVLITSALVLTACGTTSHTTLQAAKLKRAVFVTIPSTAVSMSCANHTDAYIDSYAVQEPRTMARDMMYSFNCWPHEMGTSIAALGFTLPDQWQPGMKVKVRWNRPIKGEENWIEKTTTIPRYNRVGTLFVHFFENDEVRVVSAFYFPRSTLHPILSNVTTAPPEVE